MTPSEELVFSLCGKSFLSLWSYANPRRPDGRELCDALVVFGEHIVVFSVKEIAMAEHTDLGVAAERWIKKAVDASVNQLYGARRELSSMQSVIRHDGSEGIELALADSRHIHLVAIAIGAEGRIPFAGGDKDNKGYVHVWDRNAVQEIIAELDTISDFIHYLETKERFIGTIICEGEENLLAYYIHSGRQLPSDIDCIFLDNTIIMELQKKPEFLARKEEDRCSYWWDRLIETLIKDYQIAPEPGLTFSDHEKLVRTMASENRFARRLLSTSCLGWLERGETGARNIMSPATGVGYVFGTYPREWKRDCRLEEITLRCFVARSPSVMNAETVIGLATEIHNSEGYSLDAVYFHMPLWSPEDEDEARNIRNSRGIMVNPSVFRLKMDEFPHRSQKQKNKTERNRAKRNRRKRR